MMGFLTVFQAELARRLRSRAFIIGLIFGGVGIAVVTLLPSLIASVAFNEIQHIAVAGPPSLTVPAKSLLRDLTVTIVPTPLKPPTTQTLNHLHVGSMLVLSVSGGRLHVIDYAKDPSNVVLATIRGPLLPLDLSLTSHQTPERIRQSLTFPVEVRTVTARFANASQSQAVHAVAYLLLFLLYMLIVFNSQLVLTSVAEEKTSRIAELLVASVDLSTLLAGKILASTVLALIQMAAWIVIGFALNSATGHLSIQSNLSGSISLTGLSATMLFGFFVFFALGFLQMAVLIAGVASLVNRTEDLGALGGPLFLPVIVAFIVAIMAISSPDAPFAVACSFIPILSPFVMFSRLAVSTVPTLQIVGAAVIDVLCVILFSFAGGRLYRVGMLLYGRTPSWGQILRTLVRG